MASLGYGSYPYAWNWQESQIPCDHVEQQKEGRALGTWEVGMNAREATRNCFMVQLIHNYLSYGNANFGDHNNTFFIFFLQFAYSPGENGILFHTWGSRSGSEGSMASRSQL